MIKRGSWIEIEEIDHSNGDHSFKVYIRGCCLENCEVGEEVEIKTVSGHVIKGVVSKDKPLYNNVRNLGKYAKEIFMIGKINN